MLPSVLTKYLVRECPLVPWWSGQKFSWLMKQPLYAEVCFRNGNNLFFSVAKEGQELESRPHLKHGDISTCKTFLSFPNNTSQRKDEKEYKRMNCTNTRRRATLSRGTAVFPDSWLNFHWRARAPMAKCLKTG